MRRILTPPSGCSAWSLRQSQSLWVVLSYRKSGIDSVLLHGKLVISQSPGLLFAPYCPVLGWERVNTVQYQPGPSWICCSSSPSPFPFQRSSINLSTFNLHDSSLFAHPPLPPPWPSSWPSVPYSPSVFAFSTLAIDFIPPSPDITRCVLPGAEDSNDPRSRQLNRPPDSLHFSY